MPEQPIHPDEARASLGLATGLMQHLVPQAPPQFSQTSNSAPQQPNQTQPKQDDSSELNGIKQQIIALKKEVEKALNEDKKEDASKS